MNISTITEQYLRERLTKGVREGGRGMFSFRKIDLEIGKMVNAEGSAEINLGNTKVLVGIKLDVGEPMKDKPDEGGIMTGCELLPLAHHSYDAGPPSAESVELARVIDRGIRAAGIIDLKKLFIEEKKVWNVFVDVYVLNYDGNLFDAGTLAAVAALANARMPKYEDGKVIREGKLGRFEISNLATSCTFAKVAGTTVLDTDGNEEDFSEARLTISNDEKVIRAMQKGLGGSFAPKEVDALIETAFEKSKDLRRLINSTRGD
jgi:exosome complex component RRP42